YDFDHEHASDDVTYLTTNECEFTTPLSSLSKVITHDDSTPTTSTPVIISSESTYIIPIEPSCSSPPLPPLSSFDVVSHDDPTPTT
ncbi:hypothetical protein KI387_006944, partial [Taxus chinensis]